MNQPLTQSGTRTAPTLQAPAHAVVATSSPRFGDERGRAGRPYDGRNHALGRADSSDFFVAALEVAAKLTTCSSLAMIERVPGQKAVRWLCGTGALTSATDLDEVLWLLHEPHGGLQVSLGAALVPLGSHHAVILVGAAGNLSLPRLRVVERALAHLLARFVWSPWADVA